MSQWKATPYEEFLFPVKVVSRLFRGKFLDLFKQAIDNREILFHGSLQQYETDPKSFRRLIDTLYKTGWVVYAKAPFAGPQAVLKYLGRYTHRIAISNSRIEELNDETVSFKWKDYADNDRVKVMTLSHVEFIRRFLLHVLPTGLSFHSSSVEYPACHAVSIIGRFRENPVFRVSRAGGEERKTATMPHVAGCNPA